MNNLIKMHRINNFQIVNAQQAKTIYNYKRKCLKLGQELKFMYKKKQKLNGKLYRVVLSLLTYFILSCATKSVGSAPPFKELAWNVQPNGKIHEVTENCNIVYAIRALVSCYKRTM